MAGSYPDVPGPRMAYDLDGTVGLYVTSGGVITPLTTTQMQKLNNENDDDAGFNVAGTDRVALLFPELRNIVGAFVDISATTATTVETSTNTTNGFDGTWATVSTTFVTQSGSPVGPYLRTAIQPLSISGVKAVRFAGRGTGNGIVFQALHLYGSIASGQTPDRLRLWRPTTDAEVDGAYFDWGDVTQGTTYTKTFRVKNNSSALTAHSVSVSLSALTDTTPTTVSQHSLSSDGSNFFTTLNLGDLAPGALTGVLTLRNIVSATAGLGLWSPRLVASATSWS